ncbi:MAG: amino acid permease [Candidatus Wallbacteria bacterium]|nr:amino acid permease [Candidatus Wallbacteria bacterium]
MQAIFRTKSVDQLVSDTREKGQILKKVLGPMDVTMIGIGAIIGAGIFTMVGRAAVGSADGSVTGAGPALIISFIITAIACGFTAFCYAEFASMVPVSGSAYTYSYATMGELVAWIIGWDLIIEYAIGNVAVAISWAGYFNDFIKSIFGMEIPIWLRIDYRTFMQKGLDINTVPHIGGIPIIFNLAAVGIIVLLTIILVRGIKESTRFNDFMVLIKLAVLALFVGIGIYYFKIENWQPFAPGGFTGIQVGAATIFFAYIGFDAVSTVAEECKDPAKDMPIGIIGSLVVCTIVYILVTMALTGMVPFAELRNKIAEPLVAGLEYNHVSYKLIALVSLGAIVAQTAVLLVFQMGQPRIFFSMSRDGLLPEFFGRVHKKFQTPHVATIITGVVVAILSAFCNIDEMADLCNIGTLFAFILVCAGVMILRIKDPDRHRPFKAPGGLLFPILGILFCVYLMFGLPWITWKRFIIWLVIGLLIYYSYGQHHSKLRKNPADN